MDKLPVANRLRRLARATAVVGALTIPASCGSDAVSSAPNTTQQTQTTIGEINTPVTAAEQPNKILTTVPSPANTVNVNGYSFGKACEELVGVEAGRVSPEDFAGLTGNITNYQELRAVLDTISCLVEFDLNNATTAHLEFIINKVNVNGYESMTNNVKETTEWRRLNPSLIYGYELRTLDDTYVLNEDGSINVYVVTAYTGDRNNGDWTEQEVINIKLKKELLIVPTNEGGEQIEIWTVI